MEPSTTPVCRDLAQPPPIVDTPRRPARTPHPLWFATFCSLLLAHQRASGQTVIVPPPTIPPIRDAGPSPSSIDSEAGDAEVSSESDGLGLPFGLPGHSDPLRWGPLIFHPGVSYTFTYGSGLRSRPGEESKSIIQTVSPSLSINIGRQWVLSYTPSMTFYSSDEFEDSLSHSVSLAGGVAYNDWTYSVAQNYSRSSDTRAETATQTDQQQFSTSLGANHQLNSKWSVSLSLSQNISEQGGYANAQRDVRSWSSMNWLNYHLGSNLSVGGGVGAGYVDVATGSDMTFEQYQGRITFTVSKKIDASLNAGTEVRQFLDSDQGDLVNPIFGASLTYAPFKVTSLSLNASRSVSSSYFENQVTETTSVSLAIQQRLFGRFNLSLSGGLSTSDYQSTEENLSVSRSDEVTFYRASLSTAFLTRGSVSIFYSRSQNNSGESDFSYSSDQMGFSISYSY